MRCQTHLWQTCRQNRQGVRAGPPSQATPVGLGVSECIQCPLSCVCLEFQTLLTSFSCREKPSLPNPLGFMILQSDKCRGEARGEALYIVNIRLQSNFWKDNSSKIQCRQLVYANVKFVFDVSISVILFKTAHTRYSLCIKHLKGFRYSLMSSLLSKVFAY